LLVKLLVRQAPGLPDPFLRPCNVLDTDRQRWTWRVVKHTVSEQRVMSDYKGRDNECELCRYRAITSDRAVSASSSSDRRPCIGDLKRRLGVFAETKKKRRTALQCLRTAVAHTRAAVSCFNLPDNLPDAASLGETGSASWVK